MCPASPDGGVIGRHPVEVIGRVGLGSNGAIRRAAICRGDCVRRRAQASAAPAGPAGAGRPPPADGPAVGRRSRRRRPGVRAGGEREDGAAAALGGVRGAGTGSRGCRSSAPSRTRQRFWLSVVDALAGAAGAAGLVERVAATPRLRRRGGRRAAAVRPALAGEPGRAGHRRSARAAVRGGAPRCSSASWPAAACAARGAGDPRGSGARAAPAAAGGRADGDPRRRSPLLAGGDAPTARPRAASRSRTQAIGAALGADRGLGGRPAARCDLAGRTPRSRAVRRRVLRQRAHGGRLPAGRGAGAAAAGRARPAPADVDPRAGERRRSPTR